jgi:hypothetical protein
MDNVTLTDHNIIIARLAYHRAVDLGLGIK